MDTTLNLTDHDAFYEALLAAHQGLSESQSVQFNARLLLLLANQLGDAALLSECIAAARKPFGASGS